MSTTTISNEFLLIAVPITKNQINILYMTLLYIIISTGFVILGKESIMLPSKLVKRVFNISIFQKIKELVFLYSKNMVYPFSPN